jgi:hypothetical protein
VKKRLRHLLDVYGYTSALAPFSYYDIVKMMGAGLPVPVIVASFSKEGLKVIPCLQ